jgi:prolipoprotein diacylglyceryltransferase
MSRSLSRGWPRPRMRLLGRDWSSFQACGAAGLLLGACLAMWLAGEEGLSRAVLCGLLAVAAIVFVTLAMATKVITGRESLVYYHHEVAILACCAVVLRTCGLPVLPYLDLTALGLGVFLACGRQGCLMVGCCHGKPHGFGVAYSEAHADEGFPRRYVGVRLFPVQAIESLLVLAIVCGGTVLVLQGRSPGTALSWYIATYSTLRVWLEELRGDALRAYWHRLSEAQWTSLLILSGIAMGEWQGRLPMSPWHSAMLVFAVLSMAWLALGRSPARALLQARHAGEIADIVREAPSSAQRIDVRRTSLEIRLSTQKLDGAQAFLVSLSRADRLLTRGEARTLARLIAQLVFGGANRSRELLDSGRGVFHLILRGEQRRG